MAGCTNQKTAETQSQPVISIQTKTDNAVKSTASNSPTSNSTGTETVEQAPKNSSTANQTNTVIEKSTTKSSATTNSKREVKQPQEIFYGQWVIEKPLAYGKVGTYGSDNITQLIGRKLSFSKEKATCFGDTIKDLDNVVINPLYKKTVVSKVDFDVDNPGITFDKLGIKTDSIIRIQTTDSKGNGCTFFIKDNNTLILSGGMTFFKLVR
ncbi:MAG: hypothetical protein ACREV6_07335 [Clostridium sp.]|uniref:hypothetical protein n=1 Tax=Clostridium sp. TaxID=1506 RepID=UPI003D6D693A